MGVGSVHINLLKHVELDLEGLRKLLDLRVSAGLLTDREEEY